MTIDLEWLLGAWFWGIVALAVPFMPGYSLWSKRPVLFVRTWWAAWAASPISYMPRTTPAQAKVATISDNTDYVFPIWEEHDGVAWCVARSRRKSYFTAPESEWQRDFFTLKGPYCADPNCRGLLGQAVGNHPVEPFSERTIFDHITTDHWPIVCTVNPLHQTSLPKLPNNGPKTLARSRDELARRLDSRFMIWRTKRA